MAIRIMQGGRVAARIQHATPRNTAFNECTRLVRLEITIRQKAKAQEFLGDLLITQNHFGGSRTDSLRLALHLTANAIRENTARVKV